MKCMGASRVVQCERRVMQHILLLLCVTGMNAVFVSSTFAGSPCLAAVESPESEFRQDPLKIKLSGFINTRPEDESTPVVTLGISTYRETYQFEVVNVEAPDYPRLSSSVILQQVGRHSIDFDLFGPRELLSKIGQAEPGTPFAITGLYSPRNRSLRLESVDVIGMDKY